MNTYSVAPFLLFYRDGVHVNDSAPWLIDMVVNLEWYSAYISRSQTRMQHNTAQEVAFCKSCRSFTWPVEILWISYWFLCIYTEEKKEKNYILKYFDFTEANKENVIKYQLNCVGVN